MITNNFKVIVNDRLSESILAKHPYSVVVVALIVGLVSVLAHASVMGVENDDLSGLPPVYSSCGLALDPSRFCASSNRNRIFDGLPVSSCAWIVPVDPLCPLEISAGLSHKTVGTLVVGEDLRMSELKADKQEDCEIYCFEHGII